MGKSKTKATKRKARPVPAFPHSSCVSSHHHVEENVSQCRAGQKLVLAGETSWAAGKVEVVESRGIWVRQAESLWARCKELSPVLWVLGGRDR